MNRIVSEEVQRKRDSQLVEYYRKTGRTPTTARGIAVMQQAGRKLAQVMGNGSTPDKLSLAEKRRRKTERQRAYRAANREHVSAINRAYYLRRKAASQPNVAPVAEVVRVKLDECPHCHSIFYVSTPKA